MNALLHEVIELGGGNWPKYRPNLDVIAYPNANIVCDLRDGIPLPDESVGKVYSSDFFEHLTFTEGLKLLKECYRVLADDGELEFIIPDMWITVQMGIQSTPHANNIVWGTRRDQYDIHKMWYTQDLIVYILCHEGWREVKADTYKRDSDWYLEPKFVVRGRK